MTDKHTPGPWVWDCNTLRPAEPNPDVSAVHSILDADGGYGFLGSHHMETQQELDADRALIAAAPDLLAALQIVVRDWTAQFERNGHLAPTWCKRAREAIAKAGGAE
jgi:hypothetical protein